ncbi:unnamed protein product [Schistocephalus solidus]|uniref:Uncharacterized protein n=1 Tax=Schistocephalus solidus TaxID=70667 RepID=A0A183SY83_SCHSO|nr:unnamed protein product [Schistocephalus solidus]
MLRQVQLRWSGHLVRMEDKRLPKRLFYGDVTEGARRQGGQKRPYKNTLKKSLKQLQIDTATWEDLAQDRLAWRRSVKTGSAIYEANRIVAAKTKRAARKSPALLDQYSQCPGLSNMPAMSTHLPHGNPPCRTSSDAMQQQSDNSNLYV